MKQKNYSNNKELASKQEKFIHTIEGIGDILVFETKRRSRNKIVVQGLKKIEAIIKDFFAIQKNDPDRFEQLLLSQEFFDLYRTDEEEAKLRLAFQPDKYLITFSTAVNQILRIHEAAIETKNDEISKFATYHLNWLLADISQTPNNAVFVEQILKSLADITRAAIEKQDSSMYAASIHWYIDIVFNRLRQNDGSFDLSYLNLFDKYFFSSVKYIISQNQTLLFKSLIRSLVEGVHIPTYNQGKIWDYAHLILTSDFKKYEELNNNYKIEKQINELADSEKDLDTQKKLNKWIEKFEGLKKILEPNFSEKQKQTAEKIEEDIKEYVSSQFKYNNLLEIVFAIGAYCLFKQKNDYIKYLWEYKQPPDSDAHWVGHDIIPNGLDDIISLYFRKALFERKFDFWEDHHGSEIYYKKYFILLLGRVLQAIRPNDDGKYEQIENYNLPKLHIYRLSDLEHAADNFLEIAKGLKEQTDTLRILGIDITNLDEIFDKKLSPFLRGLKIKAQDRIKNLQRNQQTSAKKIEEFKIQFIKGFNAVAVFRNILTHYNLYEDKSNEEYKGEIGRLGMNTIDDKAAFFEEWHVHFLDWGNNYGRNLAAGEDSDIAEKLSSCCTKINSTDFEKTLGKFTNLSDVVIISNNIALHRFFEDSTKFKPKWHKDSQPLEVKGFTGWYIFKNQLIPVLGVFTSKIDKQILILNTSKIGKLIQHSPLDNGESIEFQREIFYMNIQAFAEDEKLLTKFLKDPPEWLKKIGDASKQREYLKEKALIKIFERYEIYKHEEFEGYLIKLTD